MKIKHIQLSLAIVFSFSVVNVEAFPLDTRQGDNVILVSPGDLDNDKSSVLNSFSSIQDGLINAHPGDTIVLMPGIYFQDAKTMRSGTKDKPIRIYGMPGAIVKGKGSNYVFDIQHSYIELSHFTIDGKHENLNRAEDYRKKLIYIKGQDEAGITGVKILYMIIKNARDECVRIKHQAHKNEIGFSTISHCGIEDFKFNDGTKNHNGEAIYIGTAPEQLHKNPSRIPDQSNNNWIHHNIIESHGSECVDVKEASRFNLIEYNTCRYQKDLNVGGISIRGNNNIIRFNVIEDNNGAGIRLGGDTENDAIENDVYGNYLRNNNAGLKIMNAPQGKFCNNVIKSSPGQKDIRVRGKIDKKTFLVACE